VKVATTKISPQFHTVVPSEVRPWLKVEGGDHLDWYVENGLVTIKKKES